MTDVVNLINLVTATIALIMAVWLFVQGVFSERVRRGFEDRLSRMESRIAMNSYVSSVLRKKLETIIDMEAICFSILCLKHAEEMQGDKYKRVFEAHVTKQVLLDKYSTEWKIFDKDIHVRREALNALCRGAGDIGSYDLMRIFEEMHPELVDPHFVRCKDILYNRLTIDPTTN